VAEAASGEGWTIPDDLTELVERVYGESGTGVPPEWDDQVRAAVKADKADRADRKASAARFVFDAANAFAIGTLDGAHHRDAGNLASDDDVAGVVRDGPESVEVLLVRGDSARYTSYRVARPLTTGGALTSDHEDIEEALGCALRLPIAATAAGKALPVPSAFEHDGFLRGKRVLALDQDGTTVLGRTRYRYDNATGLEAMRHDDT
jgi:CRISPR-associated endonuclease/helicase Cas3